MLPTKTSPACSTPAAPTFISEMPVSSAWSCLTVPCRVANTPNGGLARGRRYPPAGGGAERRAEYWRLTLVTRLLGTLKGLKPNNFFPIPASVVFAKRNGVQGSAGPLSGEVERWLGQPGDAVNREMRVSIVDTSVGGDSPYAGHSRNGATIFPRCLLFVEKTENPAIVQAGQTVTVNPRRGSLDKEPWRSLDLTPITGQTIERSHLFDVHMGETVVPFATLDPLKAVLPLKRGETRIPADPDSRGGIRLAALDRRMRDRWRTVSGLWEENKSPANKMDLLAQLDYYGKLSAQLDWRRNPGDRLVRLVYTSAGQPTAALLRDDVAIIENVLFWVTCKSIQEAHFLLAIINSQGLYEAVASLMPKGQFGARHLHKHLWKLPIPEFDPAEELHVAISQAGEVAAAGAGRQLAQLRQERSRVTVTIARRELRKWLRASPEGRTVEEVVGRLLEGR